MANRNDTRGNLAPKIEGKKERFLTVGFCPEQNQKTPWIRIRGLWLLKIGFQPGSRVRVNVTMGCLVITPEKRNAGLKRT